MEKREKLQYWSWEEFGTGTGSVYLYYFQDEKNEQKYQGKSVWACKVGYAEGDAHKRVAQQLKKIDPDYAFEKKERPILPILFKSDTPRRLETQIHKILQALGRKIDTEKRHEWYITGHEWYLTNPNEVLQIYFFIVDFQNYAWHDR